MKSTLVPFLHTHKRVIGYILTRFNLLHLDVSAPGKIKIAASPTAGSFPQLPDTRHGPFMVMGDERQGVNSRISEELQAPWGWKTICRVSQDSRQKASPLPGTKLRQKPRRTYLCKAHKGSRRKSKCLLTGYITSEPPLQKTFLLGKTSQDWQDWTKLCRG